MCYLLSFSCNMIFGIFSANILFHKSYTQNNFDKTVKWKKKKKKTKFFILYYIFFFYTLLFFAIIFKVNSFSYLPRCLNIVLYLNSDEINGCFVFLMCQLFVCFSTNTSNFLIYSDCKSCVSEIGVFISN